MNNAALATCEIERLLSFAQRKGLTEAEDRPYYRNLLLDALRMDAPADLAKLPEDYAGDTATPLLNTLCAIAAERGLIEDSLTAKELFSARLMGLLTPSPVRIRELFEAHMNSGGPEAATDWFYDLCRACDYIRVDAIAQNIRYFSPSPVGELEITINLSKPEKDPREIAKLRSAPSVGYPRCMLCVENPGYAGRANFPARQNHRVIPLNLAGRRWYLQYSPYAYYDEHCIVFNHEHVPMRIDRGTFERLFSFVDQFPHYMLGSNADLPIVGGSILNHDHFQGGRYHFPMDKAGTRCALKTPAEGVEAEIADWPMSALRLRGTDPRALTDEAVRILDAWRSWSDPARDILAESDGTPHNTITPILRMQPDGRYCLTLVLRNNRTTAEHPLGLFHPHAELHHIKRENIGLIEVMGLFILPGRLKTELQLLAGYLTGERPLTEPAADAPEAKHFPWIQDIVARRGLCADSEAAGQVLREELAAVCAQVLRDSGVYKQTGDGLRGFLDFLAPLGYRPA
ncbi:MAG: UDP-glucose--hexose-1-phosphate uridylyltransferase [Clostridia bacterium]|nr:UDP-glucose--hexose-1-phosphate uridylyltransferase [Clostridia bacterium]